MQMRKGYPVIDVRRTGQNIKSIMKVKGIKVREVQNYLQLGSPQGIYHWFEGKSMPTLDDLYALSELFCTPLDTLLCGNRKYVLAPVYDGSAKRMYVYYATYNDMVR